MMRAVVVLPTPRTPVSMKAWAMRLSCEGVSQDAHHAHPGRSARRRWWGGICGPARGRGRPALRVPATLAAGGGADRRTGRGRPARAAAASLVQTRQTSVMAGPWPLRAKGGLCTTNEVGGQQTTRTLTHCGCFLPDLTGLAGRPSAADLPGRTIVCAAVPRKGPATQNAVRASSRKRLEPTRADVDSPRYSLRAAAKQPQSHMAEADWYYAQRKPSRFAWARPRKSA